MRKYEDLDWDGAFARLDEEERRKTTFTKQQWEDYKDTPVSTPSRFHVFQQKVLEKAAEFAARWFPQEDPPF